MAPVEMLQAARYLISNVFVLGLLAGVLSVPRAAHGAFGSPFDMGPPASAEAHELLKTHPDCGALVLYSIVANEHPELLSQNLDTADEMSSALAISYENYTIMVEAFRIIALHLSEHRETTHSHMYEDWQRACVQMEKCDNEESSSPACQSAWSAVEDLVYW